MDEPTTITLIAVSTATGALALWQARRKRPFGTVSLFPWNGLLFVALVAALVLSVHLLALLGHHVPPPPAY